VLINVKDTLQIEWASNYDEAFLYMFCHGMKDGEMYASEWLAKRVSTSGNYLFSPEKEVTPEGQEDIKTRNWTMSASCHFDLYYWENPAEDGINKGVKGPSVNISSDGSKAATLFNQRFTSSIDSSDGTVTGQALTSSGASTISMSATTTYSSSSETATTTRAAERSESGGLSSGATAGIAVGAVFGVAAIVGIAYLLYRRKNKTSEARGPPVEIGEGRMLSPATPAMSPLPAPYKHMHPSELETHGGVQEMPTSR
jgi:hypothetical protein